MIPVSISERGVYVARSKKTYTEDSTLAGVTVNESRDVIASMW